jgi:Pyridoxamine 5'-phosphate oxidase
MCTKRTGLAREARRHLTMSANGRSLPRVEKVVRVRWSDFETEQPRLAQVGTARLAGPGVVLVGTIRRDGSPRLSPVEPLFWERDLWLAMGWQSHKAGDLLRDDRILVHSIVTDRDGTDGEFKVRGKAVPVPEPQIQADYAHQVAERLGWTPQVGRFELFRVEVNDVTFIRWDDATNDQYVARWPAGTEFVRRGTSATSQGPPEPISDLLV